MKVQDFSIGDWVMVKNHYPDKMQVDGIVKKHGTYYLQFRGECNVDYELVRPIPLTNDILARNFDEFDGYFAYYTDFYSIVINEFSDGCWQVAYENTEVSHSLEVVFAFNVHQLQHILCFWGVDKDIVI